MTITGERSAEVDKPKRAPGRIASLDVVRGLFLCLSVSSASTLAPKPDFLVHAEWIGVRGVDLIFPLFVTLSGMGLAFAYRNRVGWGATLRRSAVLLAAGLAYNMVVTESADLATLRFTGALQVYAVLVLVIGLLHLVARTARAWIVLTLFFAAFQAAVFMSWQSGCMGEVLSQTCNPSLWLDLALIPEAHLYAFGELGHDPEGPTAIFGALITASAGAAAGHLALASRGTRWGAPRLLAWAAAVFAAAYATSLFLPAMKRLWTTPFALGVAALGILLLAAGLALMDSRAPSRVDKGRSVLAWPLIALGRNSLLVYFGSHLVAHWLMAKGGEPSYAVQIAEAVDVLGDLQVSFILASLGFWVVLAAILHWRRIYLRP